MKLVHHQKPFNIKLKGWNYFDHGHSVTIYIDVVNPDPIINLMKLVSSPSRSPHISLAKKIPHKTFEHIKPYLDQLQFESEWTCTEVIVLRKLMAEKHLGWKDSFRITLEDK